MWARYSSLYWEYYSVLQYCLQHQARLFMHAPLFQTIRTWLQKKKSFVSDSHVGIILPIIPFSLFCITNSIETLESEFQFHQSLPCDCQNGKLIWGAIKKTKVCVYVYVSQTNKPAWQSLKNMHTHTQSDRFVLRSVLYHSLWYMQIDFVTFLICWLGAFVQELKRDAMEGVLLLVFSITS